MGKVWYIQPTNTHCVYRNTAVTGNVMKMPTIGIPTLCSKVPSTKHISLDIANNDVDRHLLDNWLLFKIERVM